MREDGQRIAAVAVGDAGVRETVAHVFRQMGYASFEADTGERLVKHLLDCREKRRCDPVVVVSAVDLKWIGGVALACALGQARWNIPVVLLAGTEGEAALAGRLRTQKNRTILRVPFETAQLRSAIETTTSAPDILNVKVSSAASLSREEAWRFLPECDSWAVGSRRIG